MSLTLQLWLAGTPDLDNYLQDNGWMRNPDDPGVWSKHHAALTMREEPEKGKAVADGIRDAFPDFDVPDTFIWRVGLEVSSSSVEVTVPVIDRIRETCPTFVIDPQDGEITPADAPFDTWRRQVPQVRRVEIWTTEMPDSSVTDMPGATWTTASRWPSTNRKLMIESARKAHENCTLPDNLPVVLTVEAPKAQARRVFAEVVHALRTRQPFIVHGDYVRGWWEVCSDQVGPDWEPPDLNG